MATSHNLPTLLLLLLLHLACFVFFSLHHSNKSNPLPPSSPSKRRKRFSSLCSSFLKRIFSSNHAPSPPSPIHPTPSTSTPSLSSSTRSSSIAAPIPSDNPISDLQLRKAAPESDISADQNFLPLRNGIYPCAACGEIFQTQNLLEHHQTINHAVSELVEGDSGRSIVQIIFNTGWPDKARNPSIHRILKIHNSQKVLKKFEEYREAVKSMAERKSAAAAGATRRTRDERCAADGNELLRFHCATFLCDLGQSGNSALCNHQYCSVCGIVAGGFSSKMDGISTLSTSWRAHVAIPEEIEEDFKFMHVKRAMLVCRVIAGRIGCDPDIAEKDDPGFDSLVCAGSGNRTRLEEEDELLVFNPRAVLPCFVIIYTV